MTVEKIRDLFMMLGGKRFDTLVAACEANGRFSCPDLVRKAGVEETSARALLTNLAFLGYVRRFNPTRSGGSGRGRLALEYEVVPAVREWWRKTKELLGDGNVARTLGEAERREVQGDPDLGGWETLRIEEGSKLVHEA
jgi:predicted ArsR family transcriptional regulator